MSCICCLALRYWDRWFRKK